MQSILHLLDEARLYCGLLETGVRLDRPWHTALGASRDEACRDALLLGRRIAAGLCDVETLADLRELVMLRLRNVVRVLEAAMSIELAGAPAQPLSHHAMDELREIVDLLARGVDIRDCRCTGDRLARRQLARRLSAGTDGETLVDRPADLVKLACERAQSLLTLERFTATVH